MSKPRQKTTKATFSLDAELVIRVSAVSRLRKTPRDVFVARALEEACQGLVLFDRGKRADRSASKDRPAVANDVDNSEPEAA